MNLLKLCALVGAAIMSVPSQAATLVYSLIGDYTANWTLDSQPTPSINFGDSFRIESVSGTFTGIPSIPAGVADLNFYLSSSGHSLVISIPVQGGNSAAVLLTAGTQLFAGTTAAPTMLTGSFVLTEPAGPSQRYFLNVSEIAAVPEPTSWMMLMAGFGLTGAALRRRKVAVRFHSA